MDIPLNVDVRCSDGAAGKSTAIVVAPGTQEVTHVVVAGHGGEYLVPVSAVAESSHKQIVLHWSLAELAQAEPFEKVVYVGDADTANVIITPSSAVTPTVEAGYMTEAVELAFLRVEQLAEGEQAIHTGAHVEATDGRVGHVDEFVVDAATGRITHLVLRKGHLWGKRAITVPVAEIERIQADVVYLKLDKAAVERLPQGSQASS
jgi:sporulation protein YlmC with PRC-barrel domain